jgi:hypothetical protein
LCGRRFSRRARGARRGAAMTDIGPFESINQNFSPLV